MKNFKKIITTLALTLVIGVSAVMLFACGTTELNQFTISLSANNSSYGTVYGSGTYAQGEQITVYAVPKSGYEFVNWSFDGERSAIRVISVDKDVSLTANFRAKETQTEKKQYYMNSVSLWVSDYHGDNVANAGLYNLKVSVDSNNLGGFNENVQAIIPGGETPLINQNQILHSSERPLIIYLDKNESNKFDENSRIPVKVSYNFLCYPIDDQGHIREYYENYSVQENTNKGFTVLYNDVEHAYTISIAFNFVEY